MGALLPLSLQACYDTAGNRVFDARLFVFKAGTETPAPIFADVGFGTRLTNPVKLRGNGTWPAAYAPPGAYRFRTADPDGFVYDQFEDFVPDTPSTGGDGGSGGSVDDKRLFQTGFVIFRYGTGTLPGFVRMNGRTIGSGASSASERANDDTHDLFVFLWTQDGNLAVSGGRGPNAESDWVAGKTIALPDGAGRTLVGLDDLGAGAKGRLNGGLFAFGSATALGSYGGEASHVQTINEIATHTPVVSATMDAQGQHGHSGTTDTFGGGQLPIPYTAIAFPAGNSQSGLIVNGVGQPGANSLGYTSSGLAHVHNYSTNTVGPHAHNITASASSVGMSTPMNVLQPFLLLTPYVKL